MSTRKTSLPGAGKTDQPVVTENLAKIKTTAPGGGKAEHLPSEPDGPNQTGKVLYNPQDKTGGNPLARTPGGNSESGDV